jgi:hypothetical protein
VAIFAGLGETDDEGERQAPRRVWCAGAAMIGPNCMGLADHDRPAGGEPSRRAVGHVGFISERFSGEGSSCAARA